MKVTAFSIALPILFCLLGIGLQNWWLAGAGTIVFFAFVTVTRD